MLRRILAAGAAGGIALMMWTAVGNVGFGFAARTRMGWIPGERAVYEVLKANIAEPGAYLANPALDASGRFPPGEPVFGISYAGFGHEAAGFNSVIDLVLTFGAALLVAALLALAAPAVQSRYRSRVAFITLAGLLLAVASDLPRFGIGGYSAGLTLAIAAFNLGAWVLAALAMAWAFGTPARVAGS